MAKWIRVARADELEDRVGICVEIGEQPIAIFSVDGELFAIDDECPHSMGPMSEGAVEGHEVECPWHAARFDLRSGKVLCAPAVTDLATYPVRVVDGMVEVELGE